jgi:hypothetical protein
MRTTLTIQDDLLCKAKQAALARHCSLRGLVEDALRAALSSPRRTSKTKPFRLDTFRGTGVRPGVDLDHTSSLLDIMEDR